ncbi:MAG: SDR family oxidoreductase, partial [Actinomycetota bacterium]|nr:SDR family oxidoreductase [Actinomycetota bacterium]
HATVPLGHMADPAEVADAVLAMASPLFRHASGTNVVVDGGGERPPYLATAADPDPGQPPPPPQSGAAIDSM